MPGVMLPLLSSLTASEDDRESINEPPPIAESMPPLLLPSGKATGKPLLQCLPPCYCLHFHGLFCFVVVIRLLLAVLIHLINDREPDSVQPNTRVLCLPFHGLFTTSHVAAYRFPCLFPPCLTLFSLSRGLGVGPALLGGGRWRVMRRIHHFSMLQQFDIPYLCLILLS